MSKKNNFKVFNEALNADNTLNDSDYSTNTHRQNGVRPGVADSKTHNKLFRQVSIMAVALANFINSQDLDALDQDVTDLSNNLSKALDKISSIPLKEHREKMTIDHPDKSVTNAKLADNAVNARTIINKSVTNEKLADNAVNTSNIINKSVTADKLDRAYLPLTGGTVSGRTHIASMLSVGQSSAEASNIRVDGAAGNAYIALLNYNNAGNLLIDGYFNNPETATIDVTNRNAGGTVRYRSTLMDGSGNAKFANDVYANNKLLATKEYVDNKKWGSTSIIDGAVTPTKLDRPYLPLTGGTLTGNLNFTSSKGITHPIGVGGGGTGANLNVGSATTTNSTALCCINRPMWWDDHSARSLALEEDIRTHNSSNSSHADIRQMFNNYWSRTESDNRYLLSNHLSVTSGTVANGAGIPIPNGYVLNQCRFLVSFSDDNPSHYWYDINEGGVSQMDQKICRVKPGTNIVECYWLAQGYDSWRKSDRETRLVLSGENELIDGRRYYKMPAIANYICIAIK